MAPDPSSKSLILQKALDLFSEKSFHKVSVAEIADAVPNVEKSTIFYHFKSKLNLANAVIEYVMVDFDSQMMQELDQLTDPRERLEKLIDGMLDLTKVYPNIMNFLLEVIDENQKKGENLRQWTELLTGYTTFVAGILKEFGISNSEDRALILLSALDGIAVYAALFSRSHLLEHSFGDDFFQRFKKELIAVMTRP